ncbi:folate family ECF transporter S component [Caproiciproducens faecalis]|uniref:Folate family ECF transporter S component n=1 Tax=Caproiciproducens faecalis TaxID=2820301 RepID=A0ABS7DK31_9FIRM|nr:folate family ECF transporter S component [Caproiciproducens faecalis]MBW7571663.1 folate family ECF transporter S component [Caproiciproducens faecalis]
MSFSFQSIRSSVRELKNVTTIAVCGLLIALNAVLGVFTVPVSDVLQIRFSFLTIATSGFLYGPVVGGMVGAIGDVVNYVLRPSGPFFPGFTLNAFLSGFVYGLILYKKPVTVWRVLAANTIVMVLVNFLLNSLWLSIMYGKAFLAVLSVRIVTNLILLPINVAMLYTLLKFVQKIPVPRLRKTH